MARISRKPGGAGAIVPSENKVYNAGLYLRLSVIDNGKEESDSIENQEKIIREYLKQKPDINIQKVYIENGFTGTSFDRPVFNKLMEEIETGSINCIVVKDLSRFGRHALDATDYITNIFPEHDVRFVSVRDNYDSAYDDEGKSQMYVMIDNFINELYAKDISRRVCSVMRAKRKKGEYVGGYAPYGYKKSEEDKHKLVIDEEAALVVRQIYEWRALGQGYSEIYNKLNQMHIPSPSYYRYLKGIYTNKNRSGRPYPWSRHMIMIILSNQTYTGDLVQGKQQASYYQNKRLAPVNRDKWVISKDAHEAVVSRELFEKVQRINEKRAETAKKNFGKYNLPKVENIYSGKIFCADCGYAMKLVRSLSTKKDKAYYHYKCANYVVHGKEYCTPKKFSKTDLDKAVLEAINLQATLFAEKADELKQIAESSHIKKQEHERNQYRKELEQKIERMRKNLAGLYDDYKENLLTQTEYVEMKEEYIDKIDVLQQEIVALEKNSLKYVNRVLEGGKWKKASGTKKFKAVTKELIAEFIARIEIYEDMRMKIVFNFMDEFDLLDQAIQKRKEGVA